MGEDFVLSGRICAGGSRGRGLVDSPKDPGRRSRRRRRPFESLPARSQGGPWPRAVSHRGGWRVDPVHGELIRSMARSGPWRARGSPSPAPARWTTDKLFVVRDPHGFRTRVLGRRGCRRRRVGDLRAGPHRRERWSSGSCGRGRAPRAPHRLRPRPPGGVPVHRLFWVSAYMLSHGRVAYKLSHGRVAFHVPACGPKAASRERTTRARSSRAVVEFDELSCRAARPWGCRRRRWWCSPARTPSAAPTARPSRGNA